MSSAPGRGVRGHEPVGKVSPTVSVIGDWKRRSASVECHMTDRLDTRSEIGILSLRRRTRQPAYDRGDQQHRRCCGYAANRAEGELDAAGFVRASKVCEIRRPDR